MIPHPFPSPRCQLSKCRVELEGKDSLLHWRKHFYYTYNITIGEETYTGPLDGYDPETAFALGSTETVTVPGALITYERNITEESSQFMLLGNLFGPKQTVFSLQNTRIEVLWSPGNASVFIGTSNLYENSTVRVYADVLLELLPSHVVENIPDLEPVMPFQSTMTMRGEPNPAMQAGISTMTTVVLGDPYACIEPAFISFTHCMKANDGGFIEQYTVEGRRIVEEVDGMQTPGPWRTLASVLDRPGRLGLPLGLPVLSQGPPEDFPAPPGLGGPSCMFTELVAIGLPHLSTYSLQWSDANGSTYRYDPGQCINPLEIVLTYGPSEYEQLPKQPGRPLFQAPPPFVVEGMGGSTGRAVVATVANTSGLSSVIRAPADRLSQRQLATLEERSRLRRPVVASPIPPQTVFAGRDAPPFHLEVPAGAFANVEPGVHGFVYTAQLLVLTGEPADLPAWLKFYGTNFTAEVFRWEHVPYIDSVSPPPPPPLSLHRSAGAWGFPPLRRLPPSSLLLRLVASLTRFRSESPLPAQDFNVVLTATNALGYSVSQLVPFRVVDMPPSIVGAMADVVMDHLQPISIQIPGGDMSSLFESNKRDTRLSLSVGLWDSRGITDPSNVTSRTREGAEASDALLQLPGFLSFDQELLAFGGTPQIEDIGVYEIALRARDVGGETAQVSRLRLYEGAKTRARHGKSPPSCPSPPSLPLLCCAIRLTGLKADVHIRSCPGRFHAEDP